MSKQFTLPIRHAACITHRKTLHYTSYSLVIYSTRYDQRSVNPFQRWISFSLENQITGIFLVLRAGKFREPIYLIKVSALSE
jgi:hypothetical protein